MAKEDQQKDDIIGQTFGEWTVLSFNRKMLSGRKYYVCQCKCGQKFVKDFRDLKLGRSIACRDCQGTSPKRPYKTGTKAYFAWTLMRQKCTNPKNISFKKIGAFGIKVCERWKNSYADFLADVGEPPVSLDKNEARNLSLTRIDLAKDYEPGNVEWVHSSVAKQRMQEFLEKNKNA